MPLGEQVSSSPRDGPAIGAEPPLGREGTVTCPTDEHRGGVPSRRERGGRSARWSGRVVVSRARGGWWSNGDLPWFARAGNQRDHDDDHDNRKDEIEYGEWEGGLLGWSGRWLSPGRGDACRHPGRGTRIVHIGSIRGIAEVRCQSGGIHATPPRERIPSG